MNTQKPRLLTTDTLLVQETRNVMRSEYSIFDDNGTQIAQIAQAGSLGRRMLGIGVKYDIFDVDEDGKEGDKLLTITDPANVFGDTYKVLTPNGAKIATAKTKRFSLKSRLTLSVKGLSDVDVDGGFRGKNYALTSKGRPIAKIDRKYRGLKGAITGKDTYALHLEPNLNEETRAAVIGTALVIDIVRRKNDEAVAVSVS
ncbi:MULTISPECIES: LURP-one-related/scramblase family protein [Corynebacterium]|uniref:LURP-one-related/scramblase family protein n=1 Tax=Corynebacterium TaxID=1716 RepID=UPI0008A8DC1A|nr:MULTISPECIES: LURP-one-related family protein [Corynebacterium]MBC6761943.1 histidine kinase [Corynebacterium sp. LK27]MDK7110302.1 LURP-one-related family protein [Corynebacterium amycolatum]MDK7145217.1 LURP-one-related family protein [Corynebacterium amycolatum]OHR31516.1 histidine kinase [Corynebacterium sp. HMSC074C03]OMQ09260.1 histidine kinase [Corynebacterium amycolatum]